MSNLRKRQVPDAFEGWDVWFVEFILFSFRGMDYKPYLQERVGPRKLNS